MGKNTWFEVDKEGLSKILERKGGKSFVLFELIQNSWDEPGTTSVTVNLSQSLFNNRLYEVNVVDNNPEGFSKLSNAFTLFADSSKKNNAKQRGRFNLGEKLVLACCDEASIKTTTGTVVFNKDGTRSSSRSKTETGSVFSGYLRMSKAEFEDACRDIFQLIPPPLVTTKFNGQVVPERVPVAQFNTSLLTEEADECGNLVRRKRETTVRVYETLPGETAKIYELGIPVVETGDKYHVDIGQKVPVNLERDNVHPSYLKTLRTEVLNQTFTKLSDEEADTPWVRDALEDSNCSLDAVKTVVTKRFGDKAVAYDPSDPEGSKLSMSQGRPVIYGGTFSSSAWTNIRKAGVLPAAGTVTPSPKPYSEFGDSLNQIPREEWTTGMHKVVDYAVMLGINLLERPITVLLVRNPDWPYVATFGRKSPLVLNVSRLGSKFFDNFPNNIIKVDDLFLHEFGHEYSGDHLSEKYHEALTLLGAKIKNLLHTNPEKFVKFLPSKPQDCLV